MVEGYKNTPLDNMNFNQLVDTTHHVPPFYLYLYAIILIILVAWGLIWWGNK